LSRKTTYLSLTVFAGKTKNPPQTLGPQRASEAHQPIGLAEDKLHNEIQGGLSLAKILYI